METLLRVEADLLVFVLGLVLLVSIKLKVGKISTANRSIIMILKMILAIQLLLASFWALGAWSGKPAVILRNIVFFIYYVFNNLIPLIWVYHTYIQVHSDQKNIKLQWFYVVPFAFSLILVFLNPFIHDLYTIDTSNSYHTGTLFILNAAICYSYILVSLFIPFVNRKRIESRRFWTIFLFSIPPVIGSVIQLKVGGIDLIWAGAVLSILMIYLNLLSDTMNMDYLTNVYNRMQADQYISAKISKSLPGKTFSGIMIDIDKFKEINDKFGHYAGDEALKITAKLIKKCIGSKNFIARFGGDEFIVILETDDMDTVRRIADNIIQTFDKYNKTANSLFELKLSLGFDVYDYDRKMTKYQFIKHIDHLMYAKKRVHKALDGYTVSEFYGE